MDLDSIPTNIRAYSHLSITDTHFMLLLLSQIISRVLAMCDGDVSSAVKLLDQLLASEASEESDAAAAAKRKKRIADSNTTTAELYGSHGGTCGYCKTKSKSTQSFGMTCATMTCLDYQALIDLGWRRSGDYLYKQNNFVSCCTHYTIRLNVHKYHRSKQQRQVMNRFMRYLEGEDITHKDSKDKDEDANMTQAPPSASSLISSSSVTSHTSNSSHPVDPHLNEIRALLIATVQQLVANGTFPSDLTPDMYEKNVRVYPYVEHAPSSKKGAPPSNSSTTSTSASTSTTSNATHPSPFHYSTNLSMVVAACLKKLAADNSSKYTPLQLADQVVARIRNQQQSAHTSSPPSSSSSSPSSQSYQLSAVAPGFINIHVPGLIRLDHAPSNAHSSHRSKKQPFERKQSMEDVPSSNTPAASSSTSTSAKKPRSFLVKQVPAEFDETAFALYKKYQMAIHGDKESKLTPDQYSGFLCSSPLIPSGPYGGYHHHYILDGRLIAVGVVDILPSCLSSVYLFYDPDMDFLNLGTLTAMKEIEWIQKELAPSYPKCKYYYMVTLTKQHSRRLIPVSMQIKAA